MHGKRIVPAAALVAVFALFVTTPTFAQQVGVRGGWVLSDSQDGEVGPFRLQFISDQRSGFSVGGFAVVPLGAGFALQPEASFTRRELAFGTIPEVLPLVESDDPSSVTAFRMEADYLEIPVLLRIPLGGRDVPVHGLVGPSFAFNLDAGVENRFFPRATFDGFEEAVRDLDVGLVFGGGVTLGSNFVVDGRYNVGLVDIRGSNRVLDGVLPGSTKWRSFELTVGFLF